MISTHEQSKRDAAIEVRGLRADKHLQSRPKWLFDAVVTDESNLSASARSAHRAEPPSSTGLHHVRRSAQTPQGDRERHFRSISWANAARRPRHRIGAEARSSHAAAQPATRRSSAVSPQDGLPRAEGPMPVPTSGIVPESTSTKRRSVWASTGVTDQRVRRTYGALDESRPRLLHWTIRMAP